MVNDVPEIWKMENNHQISIFNKTGTLPHGSISGFVDSAKTESQQVWSLTTWHLWTYGVAVIVDQHIAKNCFS